MPIVPDTASLLPYSGGWTRLHSTLINGRLYAVWRSRSTRRLALVPLA